MSRECYIVEDLLPLYNEGLLQDETIVWLESHLKTCENCSELLRYSEEPVKKEEVHSSVNNDKMFAKINLKLSIYQIIFIALSFFLSMKTSLLNDSFGFILSYAVLGCVTFYFYRKWIIVLIIAFLPTFIWSMVQTWDQSLSISNIISGSLYLALVHLLFAVLGGIVAYLLLKLKKEGY